MIEVKNLLVLAAIVLVVALPGAVSAQPVPPHIFLGKVAVDGAPAAEGTTIGAWIDGAPAATTKVSDGSYVLLVEQGESGFYARKVITFQVGELAAVQNGIWEQGGASQLNLTAFNPPPGQALAPIADILVRVWHYDNATKRWSFYDPRPDFAQFNTVTKIIPGQVYWIKVVDNQKAVLRGKGRNLFIGWNLVPW